MNIRQMTLANFRGATALSLDLHKDLNVFVGANGAGKSSLLDAAAILLSWLVNRTKSANASGRPITETDIQNSRSVSKLEMTCRANGEEAQWKLVKSRRGHRRPDERSTLDGVNHLARWLQKQIEDVSEKVQLPVFVYYPVNRAVLDIPLRIRGKHRFDLLATYDDSLTSGANFRTFFEWFREREDLENENRKYCGELFKPEGFQFPDPQLDAVRNALMCFMPDFSNLTVRRNPLRMEVVKEGQQLTVDQLSDGEKCLMAMIGDLARRLAIANPSEQNPLEGEGVILIDEIDLHLHPRWQRMVIPKLQEVFPRCQFLISTHSPHVITHVRVESLFLLTQDLGEGVSVSRPSESYGKNVDRVLEDLMGLETTRPDPVDAGIRHIFSLIDQNSFGEAKVAIERLRELIGEDPDLVRARVLIQRKELIGK
ncbi:AAA family ATPase [Desulfoluna sp.]|uniref:AAA family ATPase n=1 Tax=Desulfoluna sp. TaxID=2045199 RepID=UPI0026177224|nr:AAA family ATPase [Desulfoluna sp.]